MSRTRDSHLIGLKNQVSIPRCNFAARPEAGGGNFNFSGAMITSLDDKRVAETIASATREKCNDSQQCRMQIDLQYRRRQERSRAQCEPYGKYRTAIIG